MTEFQAGDIVECVGASSGGFTAGRFYALSEGGGGAVKVRLDDRGSKTNGWLARNFKLAFRPPAGEVWEPWNGGECPVAPGTVGLILLRNDPEGDQGPGPLGNLRWSRWGAGSDIIAYRVIPASFTVDPKTVDPLPVFSSAIDPDKIKPGDEVTVRCVVIRTADDEGDFKVEAALADGETDFMYVGPSGIVTHTPKAKPLEAGDNVRSHTFPGVMTIRAIDAGHAWVGDCIYALGDLEHAD